MKNKRKILLPFLSAISVIALLLAGCPPTNGGGGDTAPQFKSRQLLGKTIEIIFDKDLKALPDAAKITVKRGTTPLIYKTNYDLSISSTDKKKLIITLKQSPISGQTYTVILKIGAVTGANGKAAKAKTVNLEVNIPPVLLSSGNLGFQTNSSTVLTLSFDTALKSLDTDKIQVQAKTATAGAKFGDVPTTPKLNKDDKTKIDIILKSPAKSGTSYQVLVAIGGVVSANNMANSAKLTSVVVEYSDKPVLDTINPPYILGKKLIATFNMNIDLLAENKVKLSKTVDATTATADTFTSLTPAAVVARTNTLEITLPAADNVVAGNVYRLALEAGAVSKVGKTDITNPAIKPTDMTILAAPALDESQAPYMVGDKIYITFNSPIPGLDTSKKIGVEVSTDDGASFETSDELDADPVIHSNTVLVLTLDSRDQGNTYKVTLPTELLGRNTLLTGNIELDIKATADPALVSGARPIFKSSTVFHITFKANVIQLNTDTIEVKKDDTAVSPQSLVTNGSTVVVTLTEEATDGSKWKVHFPEGTVLDTSRNANPSPITTAEGTFFTEKYRPTNNAELKTAISTEQDKGEVADFSTNRFDISQVSDMSGLFKDNSSFNGDISSWDVSHVTDMSGMFEGATNFNGNISRWNVGNVTTMTRMFKGATAFNQALQNWNVDGDTVDITEMFKDSGVEPANIPSWYIKITPSLPKLYVLESDGKITDFTFTKQPPDMTGGFAITPRSLPNGLSLSPANGIISGAPTKPDSLPDPNAFYGKDTYTITFTGSGDFTGSKYTLTKELDIGVYKYRPTTNAALVANIETEIGLQGQTANLNNIDVSGVTNLNGVFNRKNEFNGDVSKWDTSNATNMSSMFVNAKAFNQDISDWDVSNVKNMQEMFSGAIKFDNGGQPLNWGNKTGKVTNMLSMFLEAEAFNQNISGWDVSQVLDMRYMFTRASVFNQDISDWDVSNVKNMQQMFGGAIKFDNGGQPLDWGTKTGKVTNMSIMFSEASVFNQDISGWDVGSVTTIASMFQSATKFTHNLEDWKDHLGARVDKTNVFKNSGVTQANKPSWYTWHTRRK